MTSVSPALCVRNLSVSFEGGPPILQVDRLDVPPGFALGVRGPSGAGKSTCLFALAGMIEAATGQVEWGDRDLLQLDRDDRAAFRSRHIGLIFQDFLLFDELDAKANAVLQSLYLPRIERAHLHSRAKELLKRFGITEVNRPVANFSGGERQRVAVARALAPDPAIVLADEPTASLHQEAADALTDYLMADVAEVGRTLIVVSHDEKLLSRMDQVVEIRGGRMTNESSAW